MRSNIKGTILKQVTQVSDSGLHQLWLKLQHKKLKSFIICISYKPPDCPISCLYDEFMPNYISTLSFGKPIITLGDLNCDLLKRGRESSTFVDLCAIMNLTQVITEPTRITDRSATLVDVILVSDQALVTESGVIDTGISDHSLVYCILNCKIPKAEPSYISTRSYKNYDPISFSMAVSQLPFNQVYLAPDVNTELLIFNQLFLDVLERHVPVKTVKIQNRAVPFVNNDLKAAMKERDKLKRRFRLTRDMTDWSLYKSARNHVKMMYLLK